MNSEKPTKEDVRRVVATWVNDASANSPPDSYYGKRRVRRYTWPAAMEVVLNRGQPDEQQFYVTGQDVSEEGIGLFGRHKLTRGTTIWLRRADEGDESPWLLALVVHSTQSVGGFRTGVHFITDQAEQ
jgi:hypothetical protein